MKTFKEFVEEALQEPTVNRYNSNWWIKLGEKYGDYRAGLVDAESDFKIGDKVNVILGNCFIFDAVISDIDQDDSRLPYQVRDDDGYNYWVGKGVIKKL